MNGGSEHLNGCSQWRRVEFQTMVTNMRCGNCIGRLVQETVLPKSARGLTPLLQARRSFEKQSPSLLPDAMAVTVQAVLSSAEFGNEPAIPTRFQNLER
jgi:hypothetical protein